jgi:WD40 repeat protein
VALNQRGEARDAALGADAQRLGVEALNEDRLEDALLYARAAVELDESPATEGSLLSVLLRNPAALGIVDQSFGIYGAAISPDGRLMATGDDIGNVVVYDAATRAQVGRYEVANGLIQNVKFSPDGDILAVSYMDRSLPEQRSGLVDLIDPRTQELRQRVRLPPLPEAAPWVSSDVVFLPNGRDLLVRAVYGESPDGPAAPVYRVDRETGAATDPLQLGRHASSLYASATSDGKVFVTSMQDDKTWELDPERWRVERSWPVGDADGAVTPDGRLFALGSMTGEVRLLDLSSGEVRRPPGGHKGRLLRMRFTPDGATLVTTGVDGQVLLWDMEREAIAERLDAHDDEINGLDLTADGRTLITGSTDTRAILWDIGGDRRLDRRFFLGKPFDVQFAARGIAVSPDGRTLALTQSDGDVDLLDTATLRRRGGFPAMTGAALAVAFNPDGRLLAVTGLGGRVALFDTRTLAEVGDLKGVTSVSPYVAFSPNGKLLAAAEANPSGPFAPAPLHVWDVRTRKQTDFSGHSALGSVAFSPDRKLIAAAAGTLGTEIREVDSGRLIKQLVTDDSPRAVAFSPDGKLLFIGRYDGGGQLFSTTSWERVGRPLPAHGGRINSAMFTPDSGTLVTAAADGTAVLTDVKTQRRIGPPLQLAPSTYATAALSPDGSRLFAVSTRGEGISFDMSPESWKQHACLVAGRDLTPAEWRSALPEQPFRAICSSSD